LIPDGIDLAGGRQHVDRGIAPAIGLGALGMASRFTSVGRLRIRQNTVIVEDKDAAIFIHLIHFFGSSIPLLPFTLPLRVA
jgi:hypothetical protein